MRLIIGLVKIVLVGADLSGSHPQVQGLSFQVVVFLA